MKMVVDSAIVALAITNLDQIYDGQVMFGLAYILPLLIVVHFVIKFAQLQDVFVCDFIATISLYKTNLCQMYCAKSSKFKGDAIIKIFNGPVECIDGTISMKRITYLNIKIDHLAFELGEQHMWARHKDHVIYIKKL
jgi:hypothetical protein